jgi:hypothetical protein
VIEFHYGVSLVNNPDSYGDDEGPIVGVAHDGNDYFFLSGNPSSPVQGVGPVTGTPPDGIIYKFTPNFTTGIFVPIASSSDVIQLYPNPGNGSFLLNSASLNTRASVTVVNALGSSVFTSEWNGSVKQFDTNLESGVYTVKVESEGQAYFKKLVVK